MYLWRGNHMNHVTWDLSSHSRRASKDWHSNDETTRITLPTAIPTNKSTQVIDMTGDYGDTVVYLLRRCTSHGTKHTTDEQDTATER